MSPATPRYQLNYTLWIGIGSLSITLCAKKVILEMKWLLSPLGVQTTQVYNINAVWQILDKDLPRLYLTFSYQQWDYLSRFARYRDLWLLAIACDCMEDGGGWWPWHRNIWGWLIAPGHHTNPGPGLLIVSLQGEIFPRISRKTILFCGWMMFVFCDQYGSCNFFVEAISYTFWWTTETFIRISSEKYKIPTPDVPQSISPRVPEEAPGLGDTVPVANIVIAAFHTRINEINDFQSCCNNITVGRSVGVLKCQTCRSVGFKLSWHSWQVRRCSVTLEVGTRVNINNEGIKTVCWW